MPGTAHVSANGVRTKGPSAILVEEETLAIGRGTLDNVNDGYPCADEERFFEKGVCRVMSENSVINNGVWNGIDDILKLQTKEKVVLKDGNRGIDETLYAVL